jgi:hypothetical protein
MKYLFTAQFNDGSVFQQNEEDIHPNKPGKSAFTHLLEEAETHDGIALFQLKGEGHTYSVDLNDGHFEIDGIKFNTHEQNLTPKDLRLVFFRQHKHNFNVYGMEVEHDIEFFIGWQMTGDDNKNIQQTISIK